MPEHTHPSLVTRNSVVLVIALDDLPEPLTYFRYRLVLPADQLRFQCSEFRHHPLPCRFAPDNECPVALALPTIVREAQERESFRLSLAPLLPISFGVFAELDQPSLFRMQFQTKLRQPLPKHLEKAIGIRSALETHHEVIGVAYDNDVAASQFPAPGFKWGSRFRLPACLRSYELFR
jgi:hypothetical protein